MSLVYTLPGRGASSSRTLASRWMHGSKERGHSRITALADGSDQHRELGRVVRRGRRGDSTPSTADIWGGRWLSLQQHLLRSEHESAPRKRRTARPSAQPANCECLRTSPPSVANAIRAETSAPLLRARGEPKLSPQRQLPEG